MTKPNGKPCGRCGKRPKEGPFLCSECKGKCATCGGRADMTRQGYFRTYCGKCRRAAEMQDVCSRCGKERDGSHTSYCRECYQAYWRDWYARNPAKAADKVRRNHIRTTYGMAPSAWNGMLVAQGGACAICGTAKPGGRGQFHTDHDHETGKVRGLLCTRCNVGLGMFEENYDILSRVVQYLASDGAIAAPAQPLRKRRGAAVVPRRRPR